MTTPNRAAHRRMPSPWLIIGAACLLLLMPMVQAGEAMSVEGLDAILSGGAAPQEKLQELEPIVITGGFATPKIWKVSKGDHVMWVMGGGEAIPAGVQWRFEQAEARIADSQLVLYPGFTNVDVDFGFFRILTLVPTALRTAKNPDKKTMKDVLPPELYARWRALKTTYVGRDNDIEEWRPLIAITMLEEKIGKKIGQTRPRPPPPPAFGPRLRPLVDKAAKNHKVKVRTLPTVEREIKVKNVKEKLLSVRESSAVELKCFAQHLDYLEQVIAYKAQQASASKQDGAEHPRQENCDDFLIKGIRSGEIPDPAGILKEIDNLNLQAKLAGEQRDAEWIAAAQAAIAKNKSTFTLLAMNQIKSPTGYVAKLKELGYTVEEPN